MSRPAPTKLRTVCAASELECEERKFQHNEADVYFYIKVCGHPGQSFLKSEKCMVK